MRISYNKKGTAPCFLQVWLVLAPVVLLSSQCGQSCQQCFYPKLPLLSGSSGSHHYRHHIESNAVSSVRGLSDAAAVTAAVHRPPTTTLTTTLQALQQQLRILLLGNLATFQKQSQWILSRPNIPTTLVVAAIVGFGGVGVAARYYSLPGAARRTSIPRQLRILWRAEHDDPDQQSADGEKEEQKTASKEEQQPPAASAAMIGAIGLYKNFISPLLPPACRFVPTCSQYGVQAIQEFGPTKGAILTTWRLLRCSPLGGKGYDPPKWPPVSYTYSSY